MDDESLSSLICEENETFFNEEVVNEDFGFCSVVDDEYVAILLEREIEFGLEKDQSLDWVKQARLDSLSWILKMRAVFGFHFQTVYLSMTYFDRFLSRRSIDREKTWVIKLLSMACLSLAVKMEEINIPSLSEYEIEEFCFHGKVIQRMEVLVLNTLDWRMGSVTPFDFLHYFVVKLCNYSSPSVVLCRSLELILASMKEINLMEFRPSVIAAVATLVAFDQRLTRKSLESMINSISIRQLLEIEDVFECYTLLQKLNSPENLPTNLSQIESVLENSPVSSGDEVGNSSNKRKRVITLDSHFPNDKSCFSITLKQCKTRES